MDTKKESAAADVPTFKIAQVGNDRKRKKGGGLSFLRSSGARGAWSGAAGGTGAGGFAGLGMSIGQIIASIAVMGMIASGAIVMLARDGKNARKPAPKKAEVFAKTEPVKIEGDTSNLQGNTNTIPNSLGYLSGSKDGLTAEERAKRDADAAAAAEAQRLADEEAAKKAAEAEKNAAKEPAAVDPMAAAAAAAGQGPGGGGAGLGKKFGSLSSSFGGGGLAGGAGMSGGMNGQFGRGVGIKGGGGRLSGAASVARPKTSSHASSKMGKSTAKGFARKQLNVASAWSRRAVGAGKAENASVSAGNAFDSNVDAGNSISGPGMAPGAPAQAGSGGGGANPATGGGSGPIGTGAQELCGADGSKVMNQTTGKCEDIKVPEGKSAQETIDIMCTIAMVLLGVIAAIALTVAALDGGTFTLAYGTALAGVMAALGLVILGLGIAIAAMGDWAQGAVFIGTGGFIAATAMIPYVRGAILNSGTMVIAAAAGIVLGMAAKMLDATHHDKAPEAAQQ